MARPKDQWILNRAVTSKTSCRGRPVAVVVRGRPMGAARTAAFGRRQRRQGSSASSTTAAARRPTAPTTTATSATIATVDVAGNHRRLGMRAKLLKQCLHVDVVQHLNQPWSDEAVQLSLSMAELGLDSDERWMSRKAHRLHRASSIADAVGVGRQLAEQLRLAAQQVAQRRNDAFMEGGTQARGSCLPVSV